MKAPLKIAIALAVLLAAVILAYREGFILDKGTYLSASPDSIVIGKAGGERKILISTDARRWSIGWCPEWAKARKDGDTLIFRCGYMSTRTTSYDTLRLEAAGRKLSIPVKQYGKATFLSFDPDTLYFPREGGKISATFSTDGEKVRIVSDQYADCQIQDQDQTVRHITVTMKENTGPYEIRSYIIVHSDQLSGELYYRQPGTGQKNAVRKTVIKAADPCEECGGMGKILSEYNIGTGEKTYRQCPACKGTGKK